MLERLAKATGMRVRLSLEPAVVRKKKARSRVSGAQRPLWSPGPSRSRSRIARRAASPAPCPSRTTFAADPNDTACRNVQSGACGFSITTADCADAAEGLCGRRGRPGIVELCALIEAHTPEGGQSLAALVSRPRLHLRPCRTRPCTRKVGARVKPCSFAERNLVRVL